MNAVIRAILVPFRHLSILLNLHTYVDEEERRQLLRAIVIGSVVWAFVFVLTWSIHWLFEVVLRWSAQSYSPFSIPVMIYAPLLLGGLIVALLTRYGVTVIRYQDRDGELKEITDVEGDGLERAIALYYTSEPSLRHAVLGREGVEVRWSLPTLTLAARKSAAMLATLGLGGSGGLAAGVALVGESIAAGLFKPRAKLPTDTSKWWTRLLIWWRSTDPDDLETAQLNGIAAAMATLLGAPIAAAFFATEIMYRRRLVIDKLVYALVASLTAYVLTRFVSGSQVAILHADFVRYPPFTLMYYIAVIVTAVAISMLAIYFTRLRISIRSAFRTYCPTPFHRHLAGAAITGTIALLATSMTGFGLDIVLGPGESVINMALTDHLPLQIALIALVAKLFATLATIGSGGSAGLLMPSIFFGSAISLMIATLFGYTPMLLVIPAITASMVSLVNVPLAAMLLTVELFGAPYLVPCMVTLVVALLFAHDNTIYRTQREWNESREILPGYSIRRITIPRVWAGRTLRDLNIRARYDVNVIGMIEPTDDGNKIFPKVDVELPLKVGKILIVLGEDAQISALEARLQEEALIESGVIEGEKKQ